MRELINWNRDTESGSECVCHSLMFHGVLCRFWVWPGNSQIPEGAYILDDLVTAERSK